MNPYIINRQPQPNLVDAFMRGYGQMDDIRANKQTREMNDLRLQGERENIERQKQAMATDQKLKQAFGMFLQKNKNDVDSAQRDAVRSMPELALPLTEMFAKYKESQAGPAMPQLPMSVAETNWFIEQPPEIQERHMALKRTAPIMNLGGEQVVLDPITKEIAKSYKTTPKPLEEAKLGIDYAELGLKKQENERKEQVATQQAKEFEEKHKTSLFAKKQEVEKIDSFVNELEDLSKSNLTGNYGAGKMARIVPGSKWATTNAKINKLLSSGVLQVMSQLKASSSTGSTGFGALSEKEMGVLQSAFSILNDRNIEPEVASQEIKKILNITKKYKDNIKNYKFGETTQEGSADPLGLGLFK